MLPFHALLFVPLVNAWTFRTTTPDNKTEIARGEAFQPCTNATIGQDRLFTWDPEGSDLCVSIYRDTECKSRGGYSCTLWRKNASAPFEAFDVMLESEIVAKSLSAAYSATHTTTTTTTPTPDPTTTTTPVHSASATPTDPAAAATSDDGGSSGSSLSGGAIAGVVIGVIAGVAILLALAVLYMKRKNKNSAPVTVEHGGYGPHEADATNSSISGTTVIAEKGGDSAVRAFRPPPGSRVVELVGDERSAELGSSPISEMDGQTAVKPFNRV
ncbi:uncharacterized protein N7515_009234 [Penicillium bovifimosum]|uniref:Mid2 domain-containing protein n=1 Tax=Penicillium bovifimosum TaxID=126998 RepID=A0A9W9GIW7_9EURO|nr:uncharacterized protein N7515_009234 [Penicillium bovifimosum]KAJ5121273.1 hypothetical protein N7515_009234 [Penicillium bovifimosum]